jgi:hypothetical protein
VVVAVVLVVVGPDRTGQTTNNKAATTNAPKVILEAVTAVVSS